MKRTLWKWAAPVGVLALVAVWVSAQEDNKPGLIDPASGNRSASGYPQVQTYKTQLDVRQPDGSVKPVMVEDSTYPIGQPGLGSPSGMGMPGRSGASPSASVGEPMRVKLVPRTVYESQMVPISESELRDMQSYQVTLQTLRNENLAEDTKANARVMLAKFVALQFDRDLESREKDVVELEARVKKLREQLDKRKAAREKIIELRLTTIQNEIDGLGFPGGTGMAPGEGFTGPAFGSSGNFAPNREPELDPNSILDAPSYNPPNSIPSDPRSLPFPVRAEEAPPEALPVDPTPNVEAFVDPAPAKKYSPVELPPARKKSEEEAAINILQNPSFEDGPQGWGTGNNPPTVEYRVPEKAGVDGTRAAEIKKTENKYFPISAWEQTIKYTGDAPAIQSSATVKTENATKAILDVLFLDDKGEWIKHEWAAYIGDQNAEPKPLTHDWKEYKGAVAIPAGTKQIVIGLQDYGPGTVWFDDVSAVYLKELPKEPNNVPK